MKKAIKKSTKKKQQSKLSRAWAKIKDFVQHNAYFAIFWRAIAGGLAICLGTAASRLCPYPILSPLIFSVGILMVVRFDWGLITRHFPTQKLGWITTPLIIIGNLLSAYLVGYCFDFPLVLPENLFVNSIVAGAVIGLVSFNSKGENHPYKLAISLLLMYLFVSLGLPHIVVISFLHASLPELGIVLVGNVIGGLGLRVLFKMMKLD